MKKVTVFALVLVLLVSLCGCQNETLNCPSVSSDPTICDNALSMIASGDTEGAYVLLRASNDPQAKNLLANFAFVPLSISFGYRERIDFMYNDAGNLSSRIYYAGDQVYEEDLYRYYPTGELETHIADGSLWTYTYTYNKDGSYRSIYRIDDNRTWFETKYTRDEYGRVTLSEQTSNSFPLLLSTTYAYDERGNCTIMHKSIQHSKTYTVSEHYRYIYNDQNLLIYEECTGDNTNYKEWSEYDDAAKLIHQKRQTDKGITEKFYERDDLGRLIKETYVQLDGDKDVEVREYDIYGNVIFRKYQRDDIVLTYTYLYDGEKMLEEHVVADGYEQHVYQTFDHHGNLLTYEKTETAEADISVRYSYEYDECDRIVKVLRYLFGNQLVSQQYYSYDAYGHIVEVKKLDENGENEKIYKSQMEIRYFPHGVPGLITETYKDNLYQFNFDNDYI